MKISHIDPLLVEGAKDVTLCKWCKFNMGNPKAPYCEKFPRDGIEMKPASVQFRYGREGKCPQYKNKFTDK